jgi:hypothetical protein
LRTSQLEASTLRAEVKTLQEKLAAATTELAAKRGTKNARQRSTTQHQQEDLLRNVAKKFCVTDEPWLDSSIFALTRLPVVDPTSPERFKDDDNYDRGILTALYQAVPEGLHEDMINDSEFKRAVCERLFLFFRHI